MFRFTRRFSILEVTDDESDSGSDGEINLNRKRDEKILQRRCLLSFTILWLLLLIPGIRMFIRSFLTPSPPPRRSEFESEYRIQRYTPVSRYFEPFPTTTTSFGEFRSEWVQAKSQSTISVSTSMTTRQVQTEATPTISAEECHYNGNATQSLRFRDRPVQTISHSTSTSCQTDETLFSNPAMPIQMRDHMCSTPLDLRLARPPLDLSGTPVCRPESDLSRTTINIEIREPSSGSTDAGCTSDPGSSQSITNGTSGSSGLNLSRGHHRTSRRLTKIQPTGPNREFSAKDLKLLEHVGVDIPTLLRKHNILLSESGADYARTVLELQSLPSVPTTGFWKGQRRRKINWDGGKYVVLPDSRPGTPASSSIVGFSSADEEDGTSAASIDP